ncbi:hypothetical protein [Brachybacterium sp. GPGPB12]|uniref:hypothetical protein n=1 Tax=Brachybacterium sp. GPGPB12 TaxID=3023517 RepID=UPI00313457E2
MMGDRHGRVHDQVSAELEGEVDPVGADGDRRRIGRAGLVDHAPRRALDQVGDADELRDLARDDLPGPPVAHRSGTDDDHACGTLRGQAGEAGQGG